MNLEKIQQFNREKIKGLTLTLPKVLNACVFALYLKILKNKEIYFSDINNYNEYLRQTSDYLLLALHWKFLNEDGTDCTLEQQSEELQFAVAKLLGYEEE